MRHVKCKSSHRYCQAHTQSVTFRLLQFNKSRQISLRKRTAVAYKKKNRREQKNANRIFDYDGDLFSIRFAQGFQLKNISNFKRHVIESISNRNNKQTARQTHSTAAATPAEITNNEKKK